MNLFYRNQMSWKLNIFGISSITLVSVIRCSGSRCDRQTVSSAGTEAGWYPEVLENDHDRSTCRGNLRKQSINGNGYFYPELFTEVRWMRVKTAWILLLQIFLLSLFKWIEKGPDPWWNLGAKSNQTRKTRPSMAILNTVSRIDARRRLVKKYYLPSRGGFGSYE